MPIIVDDEPTAGVKEQIVLDPVEVAVGRAELDLHSGRFLVEEAGVDWGDAAIVGYMAELSRGELPVDFRIPNRKPTIPLLVQSSGGSTFSDARIALQQKIGLFHRKGGWVKRELRDGSKLYLEVVGATLKMGGGSHQARGTIDPDVTLELETLPDWYGDEIQIVGGS